MYFSQKSFAQVPPSSNNYKILDYSVNNGGVASSSSTGYSIMGDLGQTDQGSPASSTYFIGGGLEYQVSATEAAMPTFTNPNHYYNKLHFVLNKGGDNPSDYEYAIEVSTDNFATTIYYIENDDTLGTTLTNSNWQTYTLWGGATGFDLIGLTPGTTYYARVASRQGQYFTQSLWSPIAVAATENPSFSLSLSTNSVNIGTLTPATVTTSGSVNVNVSTNGTSGATVYIFGTNDGLLSSSTSYIINSATADLAGASEGYGAQATSVTQSSGGPMEIVSPYNGISDNVGIIDTSQRVMFDSSSAPVTTGQGTFSLKAKPSTTAKAADDYGDTLTVLASAQF